MKENKKNDCAINAQSDEQLSSVTGGMYHGYLTSHSNPNKKVLGTPSWGPGTMGPGMGYDIPDLNPPTQYLNPMTEGHFVSMRPGMAGPGMNYTTAQQQTSSTEE